MTKKVLTVLFVAIFFFLCGCGAKERIVLDGARGNNDENVEAVLEISRIDGVRTASVLCDDDTVMAGLRLSESDDKDRICKNAHEILKEKFPEAENYIVGADDQWSEAVIELNLYAEGGMDRKVLEKRFDFLKYEKLGWE